MIETATILILGENESVLNELTKSLQDEGFNAEIAHGGEEAVEIVSRKSTDAVLLDVRCSHTSGCLSLAAVHKIVSGAAVLFITDSSSENASIRNLRTSETDYLPDSSSKRDFVCAIKKLCAANAEQRHTSSLMSAERKSMRICLERALFKAAITSGIGDEAVCEAGLIKMEADSSLLRAEQAGLEPEETHKVYIRTLLRGIRNSKCSGIFAKNCSNLLKKADLLVQEEAMTDKSRSSNQMQYAAKCETDELSVRLSELRHKCSGGNGHSLAFRIAMYLSHAELYEHALPLMKAACSAETVYEKTAAKIELAKLYHKLNEPQSAEHFYASANSASSWLNRQLAAIGRPQVFGNLPAYAAAMPQSAAVSAVPASKTYAKISDTHKPRSSKIYMHTHTVHINLMGSSDIFINGKNIDSKSWMTSKIKNLFLILACSETAVPISSLTDALWSGKDLKIRECLWKAASVIRKVFKNCGCMEKPLIKNDGCIKLSTSLKVTIDALEIKRLWSTAGRNADTDTLKRIASLCKGKFMPGCELEWACDKRTNLELICIEALLELCRRCSKAEKWDEVFKSGTKCLKLDPYCEEACCMLMQACIELGRPSGAVSIYKKFEQTLAAALDSKPGTNAFYLYEKARGCL